MAHQGEVKSFNATKGYGFIVSNSGNGKDIFMPKKAMPQGANPKAGDQVNFDISEEATGLVASNVSFPSLNGGYGALGALATTGGDRSDPFYGMGYLGTVKSVNREKGSGFIESAVMRELHGKDAFFSLRLIPGGGISPGDRVFFCITVDEKGPTCNKIEIVSAGPSLAASYPPMQYQSQFGLQFPGSSAPPAGANYGPAGGKGAPGRPMMASALLALNQPAVQPAFMPEARASKPTRYFGQVRSFNEEKGWGHIECDAAKNAFGKDIFLMRQELPDGTAQVGDLIGFKVQQGQKGPKATECTVLPPNSFAIGGQPGSRFYGTVKSFNAEKKWGFLAGDQITAVFGKDVFVNLRSFMQGNEFTPQVGDEVSFTVEIEPQGGKPEAKQVSLVSGGLGGAPRSAPY